LADKERVKVLLEVDGKEPRLVGTILGFDIQPVGKKQGNIADGGPWVKLDWIDNYGEPKVVAIRVASIRDTELLKGLDFTPTN
jgi:hypothetical protein